MSLNYKLDKIDDFKVICYNGIGDLTPVTKSIVFATMSVEMGEITEANAAEFWARANLYQRYIGPWFHSAVDGKTTPVVLTEEDIVAHIGLWTNVATRTRRQWLNSYLNQFIEDDAIEVRKILGQV